MATSDREAVVAALRDNERFVVTSHDNPDGDALGSLFATHLALSSLGKDSVMVLGGEQPLPGEFGFLRLEEQGLLRAAPDDVSDRVLVAVDCAQESRIVEPTLLGSSTTTLNIDHHHDNTRFGDVDLVVEDASSTAEVLADVFDGLGVTRTPEIAEALYTAVVTDTGGSSTRTRAPRLSGSPRISSRTARTSARSSSRSTSRPRSPSCGCSRGRSSMRPSSRADGSSSPSCAARTSRRQGRTSPTRKASSTISARSTAPSSSRSSASCRRARRRAGRGRCARIRTGSTSP